MKNLLFIFAGGGAGSVLRYLLSRFMQQQLGSGFPWGTFTVNALGCLLLGIILAVLSDKPAPWRLLLAIGFCGGFTTFSTFAYENIKLLQTQPLVALLYMGISLAVGIGGVGFGLYFGKLVR